VDLAQAALEAIVPDRAENPLLVRRERLLGRMHGCCHTYTGVNPYCAARASTRRTFSTYTRTVPRAPESVEMNGRGGALFSDHCPIDQLDLIQRFTRDNAQRAQVLVEPALEAGAI